MRQRFLSNFQRKKKIKQYETVDKNIRENKKVQGHKNICDKDSNQKKLPLSDRTNNLRGLTKHSNKDIPRRYSEQKDLSYKENVTPRVFIDDFRCSNFESKEESDNHVKSQNDDSLSPARSKLNAKLEMLSEKDQAFCYYEEIIETLKDTEVSEAVPYGNKKNF
ncbi:hypothetical protein RFI_11437 [Reticulomyxa filosa]|uniref:Uncharacterized protein n=1 Tax=Reticulomyxa filosa TaxID=46433 RepID=X6NK10_RETFI|nr:hypothetical protein RFI_11437 [Reticulomyxa filosa]|eukprot:ETO25697.1 hypothetical protein RFI_11437 [Reticulomyxa filosa]